MFCSDACLPLAHHQIHTLHPPGSAQHWTFLQPMAVPLASARRGRGGGGVSNTEQGLAQGCSMAATHPTPPCGAHGGLRGLIGASWATPPPQPSLPSPRVSGHRNTILRYDRGPPEGAQREAVHYKNTPALMKLLSNTDVVPTSFVCGSGGGGGGEGRRVRCIAPIRCLWHLDRRPHRRSGGVRSV